MKKSVLITTCLLLIAALSLPAFAQDQTKVTVGGDYNIPIATTVYKGTVKSDVISMDIRWDAMSFSYREQSVGTWNTVTHKYEGAVTAEEAGWEKTKRQLSVTSHSNIPVVATYAFERDNSLPSGTKCEFFDRSDSAAALSGDALAVTLPSSEGRSSTEAPSSTVYFGVSGAAITAAGSLGSISVRIGSAVHIVNSYEQLCNALANGGHIRLGCDITAQDKDTNAPASVGDENIKIDFEVTEDTYIDLNGKTLTFAGIRDTDVLKFTVKNGAELTFKGGKMTSLAYGSDGSPIDTGNAEGSSPATLYPRPILITCEDGDLVLDNCEIYSQGDEAVKLTHQDARVFIRDSTLCIPTVDQNSKHVLKAERGTVITEGDCKLCDGSNSSYKIDPDALIIMLPGTYNWGVDQLVSLSQTYIVGGFYEATYGEIRVKSGMTVVTVSSKQGLLNAIDNWDSTKIIQLTEDIQLDGPITTSCNIDLAGHKLSAPTTVFHAGSTNCVFNIQNGTVEGVSVKNETALFNNVFLLNSSAERHTLMNLNIICKQTDGASPVLIDAGYVTMKGRCYLTLKTPIDIPFATTRFNTSSEPLKDRIQVTEGKYNFKPDDYYSTTDYTLQTNNTTYIFRYKLTKKTQNM